MTTTRRDAALAALVAAAAAAGFETRAVLADGIPSPNPLYYAGTLTESGQLVGGTRAITVTLWPNPAPTPGESAPCVTIVPAAPVTDGRFRIALDSSCAAAVSADANPYVEVSDQGTSLGRAKIGAVPYAVEASHAAAASSATGDLQTTLGTLQSNLATLQSLAVTSLIVTTVSTSDNIDADTNMHITQCLTASAPNVDECAVAANRKCVKGLGYTAGWLTGEGDGTQRSIVCVK